MSIPTPNVPAEYDDEFDGEILVPRGRPMDPLAITEDFVPLAGTADVTVASGEGEVLHRHRFSLARWLLALVGVVSIGLLLAVTFGPSDHIEAVKAMGNTIFTALVTLLGSSFAWYYATRKTD